MQLPTFIRLENTFEKAMSYRNSPRMSIYSFKGVQLLPNNPYPYIQRTYATEGIEIASSNVLVKDMCGNTLENITTQFVILNAFNDPDTGLPQVEWELQDVPYDFGNQLIYLEIQTGVDVYVYSSPFMLTAFEQEYTSDWYYWAKEGDTVYSIGLQIYFKQEDDEQELTNYTPVSTGKMINVTSRLTPLEVCQTRIIDINLFRLFKQIFLLKYRYSKFQNDNGLPVETGLHSPFETPRLEQRENFADQEILLLRDYDYTYDPLAPIIPIPPPPDPAINLISVTSLNKGFVSLVFELIEFDPSYLTYQYSLDGVNWINNTSDPISPKVIGATDNHLNDYYYRIIHEGSGLESNILQLPPREIEITNIVSPDSEFIQIGNDYNIYFTINFTLVLNLSFYASTDDDDYVPLYPQNVGNNSPKPVQTPSSGLEFKYFKVIYNDPDNDVYVESEPYFFEFETTT